MLGRRFTSSRIRKQHQKRVMIMVLLWIILAGATLFLIVELVNIKQLRVERIRFEGNSALTDPELFAVVAPYLEGSYLHLFSRRNILIVPNETIEKKLLAAFVRLNEVTVSREGFHTLLVQSIERKPSGLWCDDVSLARRCYFLDDNGLAFSVAPSLSGGMFITFSRSFPERVIGAHLTPSDAFHTLRTFIDSIVALGFHTEHVTWTDDAIELSVRTSSEEEGARRLVLKIPLQAPYEITYSNLASILKKSATDAVPLSLDGIDYIDLRFENKVFYKKEAAHVSASTTSESAQ